MGPVGGWTTRVTVTDTPPRGAIAWTDLTDGAHYAVGTATKLLAISSADAVTDITPAGLTAGQVDAAANRGFGGGLYGAGTFGTRRPSSGTFVEATTWALENWGEYLLACSTDDGRIWEWQLDTGLNGVVVSGAPTNNKSIVVTEERFVFALGAGGTSRKVQWCDRENNTSWTPTVTNEAGDLELQTSGQIMCGVRARGQTLILTDIDAHSATYQGPPYVYGFSRVGTACGVISRKAAVAVDAGVFWMGDGGFFIYDGSSVSEIKCDVGDYIFSNGINYAQKSKIYGVANAQHGEVWWFYPSDGSTENNRYVTFNFRENHWAIGAIVRTAGFDYGVFDGPIWFNSSGVAYNHEDGFVHDATPYAETGPIILGAGDAAYSITNIIGDEAVKGQVSLLFKGKDYPNGTTGETSVALTTAPSSVRITARQFKMKVVSAVNEDWRVGTIRLDVVPRGKR